MQPSSFRFVRDPQELSARLFRSEAAAMSALRL
jgi:hypothetical protein